MSGESKVVEETAKATQEIAKVASKAIDSVDKFGGFMSKFISGPLMQGSGMLEDYLKLIRWERQESFMKRLEELMKGQGIENPTKPIQLKNAIPFFQAALLEEDDDLQGLWAKLLVNSTNTDSGINLHRSYIDILERLSPFEAKILNLIYTLSYEETKHTGIRTEKLPDSVEIDNDDKRAKVEPSDEVKLALSNLVRLDCLIFPTSWGGGEIFSTINTTYLGKCFVEACTLN